MYNTLKLICLLLVVQSCKLVKIKQEDIYPKVSEAFIDLSKVENDQVNVRISPTAAILNDSVLYHFPKIIPGTYALANYGKYIKDIKALDHRDKALPVSFRDSSTIVISNARKLKSLSYKVNDTFDSESGQDVFNADDVQIFSPAGTNILADKNFVLNLCGFVGFFDGQLEQPYAVNINHPKHLFAITAAEDLNKSETRDSFYFSRYASLVDAPVMYAEPDTISFRIGDMEVLMGIYSKNKNLQANTFSKDLERMMRSQKVFLGKLNDTKKYAIIAYLTTSGQDDARGIGALEHHNSTLAVFRGNMSSKDLIHVISHEFFHTVSPLKIHSQEIHNFNFIHPEMSKHLWFYEGVTEYFANLFQVNQGLINENSFFDLMAEKIINAKNYDDSLSFTTMSKNILKPAMKKQYPNVYQKGALMAMCLDIILRKNSEGKKGLLHLVRELSLTYGENRPFSDDKFIPGIKRIIPQEARDFIKRHIEDGAPVDYTKYLKMAGLSEATVSLPEPFVFITHDNIYLTSDDENRILIVKEDNNNKFLNALDLRNNDVLVTFNGLPFQTDDVSNALLLGYGLEEGSPVKMNIIREGKPMLIEGKVHLNYSSGKSYRFTSKAQESIKNSWLKAKDYLK